jgi:hypothetical protein
VVVIISRLQPRRVETLAMKGDDQEPVLSLSNGEVKSPPSFTCCNQIERRLVELMGFEPTTF